MHYEQHKPLFIFTAISLAIHLLLLTQFSLRLPDMNESQRSIEMRLVHLTAKQIHPPSNLLQSQPKIKTKSLNKPEIVQNVPNEETPMVENKEFIKIEDDFIPPADEEAIVRSENTTNTAENDSPQVPTSSENPVPVDPESISSTLNSEPPQKPSPQGYKYVESEFAITRGTNTSIAGSARIIFNIDDNGTYLITSLTEAKGLVSLFLGKLTQKSVGVVNENGLLPDFFSYQYGSDTAKEQTARFAWKEGVLHIRSVKGNKTEPLKVGTQDLLSFMYQFMFSPPLENTQIIVTNGKNLRTYDYQFVGEIALTTSMGNMNTIHLIKTDDDQEKTELWLATDYQYLPVKIRKTEKNGEVIEQIITKISAVSR